MGVHYQEALEYLWPEWVLTEEGAGAPEEARAMEGVDREDEEDRAPHILIVDDDESFGFMLERAILRLTGYDCTYVKDANKAVQVLEESVVDVVITDIRMPGMNGLELTRLIKGKCNADIIVITGYHEDFFYEDAIEHGANDFIEKPVRPSELVTRLKRVLRERASSAKHRQAQERLRKLNLELEKRVEERHAELLRINALLRAEIEERRQAEEELRQSNNRYRLSTNAAHEGIWDMDLINNTVRWNKTFSDQFGDPPETRLSWQWWVDRMHPEDSDRTIAGFTEALKGATITWNQEYRFLRPNGAYAHVLNRAYIERDKTGRATNIYGAMLDITPLRQIEIELKKQALQLEQANRELESFSYSVTHDLREPLRAIDGFSRMLLKELEGTLTETTRVKFNVIRERTRKMDQLINDIFAFHRLNRQALKATVIDLESLAGELANECLENHPQQDIKINISSPLPVYYGDRKLIRQVLANLLANAVKFSRGKETSMISIGGYENAGGCVCYVRDNGIGFNMRYYDKLFKVFRRLHSDEEFEGTGVGLSIVKRIIERHGGRVWAEGAVDKGATFYFSLPKKY